MASTHSAHLTIKPASQQVFRAVHPHAAAPRRFERPMCRAGGPAGPHQVHVVQPTPPTPPPTGLRLPPTSTIIMGAVIALQGLALVGATVTGVLARKRREEMEALNSKLRTINAQLRRQREEEELSMAAVSGDETQPGPDMAAYRTALERSLGAPAAAHPVEAFGDAKLSLAGARRRIAANIKEVKRQLRDGCSTPWAAGEAQGQEGEGEALVMLADAQELAEGIQDLKAQRAVVRLRARVLRKRGDLEGALQQLNRSMQLSLELGESSGDADALGEIGDVLTEMGDFERAGQFYDRCIAAIEDEVPQSLSSTWDCQ